MRWHQQQKENENDNGGEKRIFGSFLFTQFFAMMKNHRSDSVVLLCLSRELALMANGNNLLPH